MVFLFLVCSFALEANPLLQEWRWHGADPQGCHLYAVGTDGTRLYAVGESGTILSSRHGFEWQIHPTSVRESLRAVAHGDGLTVAVGDRGTIVSSSNGNDWTEAVSGTIEDLRGIAHGQGLFVAVGENSTILTSHDGLNWTVSAPADPGQSLMAISFGGGWFVIAQNNDVLQVSSDGFNWQTQIVGGGPFIRFVTHSHGTFYAMALQGLFSSPNAIDWVRQGGMPPFISMGMDDSQQRLFGFWNRLSRSTSVYFSRKSSITGNLDWGIYREIPRIGLWDIMASASRFVLVGDHGFIVNLRIPDGISPRPLLDYGGIDLDLYENHSAPNQTLHDFGFLAAHGAAVGVDGKIFFSTDGDHWNEVSSGTSRTLRALDARDGLWVAVGDSGALVESVDGANWATVSSRVNQDLHGVAAGPDGWVAAGDNGALTIRAAGGGWSRQTTDFSAHWRGVAASHDRYVAVGEGGAVITRSDGGDWVAVDSGTNAALLAVGFGDGRFVAAGAGGLLLHSGDGLAWTAAASPGSETLRAVHHAHGVWTAAGDAGVLLVSENGIDWETRDSGTSRNFYATGSGFGRVYAGGAEGLLLGSPLIELDPPALTVGAAGGTREVTVRAAVPWTAEGDFSVAPPSGPGDTVVTVSVPAHAGVEDREMVVWVNDARLSVLQEGTGARIDAGVSGYGEVTVDPDIAGQRVAPGTVVRLTATPAQRFAGWSGLSGAEAEVEIVLQEDLNVTAHFFSDAHLLGAASLGERIVAGGRSGTLLSSRPDGFEDILVEGGDRRIWNSLATGHGRTVAVARDGSIALTEEGEEWITLWAGPPARWWRVVFHDGQFHALGDAGALYRSSDAVAWEAVETGTEANLRGIAFSGETAVLVGQAGTLLRSTGGGEWSDVGVGTGINWRDVAHGPAGFVAVGGAGAFYRSADGFSWTPIVMAEPHLAATAYGNGRYVVLGGLGHRVAAWVSENAMVWERHEIPHFTSPSSLVFDGTRFLAPGGGGTVLSSLDGERWTAEITAERPALRGIAETPAGGMVAVGQTGRVLHADGEEPWKVVHAGTSRSLWDVATGAGATVAVGDDGVILRTENGSVWETIRGPNPEFGTLGGVIFAEGFFLAVGGGAALRSADGWAWEEGALPGDSMYWAVARGNGLWVAAGEGGAAAFSHDGLDWSPVGWEVTASIHAAAFQETSGFALAGAGGFVARSLNGVDWVMEEPVDSQSWEALSAGTGWLVALGEEGATALSADGKIWQTPAPGAPGGRLRAGWVDASGAVAMDETGAVSRFPLPPLALALSDDVAVGRGGEVTLTVEAGGTGPFSYTWRRDGQVVHFGPDAPFWLSDVGREAIGEYWVTIANQVGGTMGETTGGPVFVTVLTRYADWREERFADPNDPAAAPAADPDGIGIPNLLFHALDLPADNPRAALPVAGLESAPSAGGTVPLFGVLDSGEEDGRFLTLTFPRAIGAHDVVYTPEASGDLAGWTALPEENVLRTIRQGTRELVTVRDTVSLDEADGKRFLRLRVDLQD